MMLLLHICYDAYVSNCLFELKWVFCEEIQNQAHIIFVFKTAFRPKHLEDYENYHNGRIVYKFT